MATCPTGTYELDGQCYDSKTTDWVQTATAATTTATTGSTTTGKDKKSGFNVDDIIKILGVLGNVAPGVIAASKGQTVPTKWTDPNNPYGDAGSGTTTRNAAQNTEGGKTSGGGDTGIPKMVWYVLGGVVALVLIVVGVKAMAKKKAMA